MSFWILISFDTLFMSNYLPFFFFFFRHLGTQSQGKRSDDHSSFFRLYGALWGLGFSLFLLCQGALIEGDESPCNDKMTCFSIV